MSTQIQATIIAVKFGRIGDDVPYHGLSLTLQYGYGQQAFIEAVSPTATTSPTLDLLLSHYQTTKIEDLVGKLVIAHVDHGLICAIQVYTEPFDPFNL